MLGARKRAWTGRVALPAVALAFACLASGIFAWLATGIAAAAALGAAGAFAALLPAALLLDAWLGLGFRGLAAIEVRQRLAAAATAREPAASVAPFALLAQAAVIFLGVRAAAGFAGLAYRRADLAALVVAVAAVGAFLAAVIAGRLVRRLLRAPALAAAGSARAWLPLASPLASSLWATALLVAIGGVVALAMRADLAAADLSDPVALLALHGGMVLALAGLLAGASRCGSRVARLLGAAAVVVAAGLVAVGAFGSPGGPAVAAAANRVPGVGWGLDLGRAVAGRAGDRARPPRPVSAGGWQKPPPRFVDPSRLCPGGDCNVVFIGIDSWRADELTFHGSPRLIMPRVEALAAEGVIFRNNYTPGPGTILTVPAMLAGVFDSRIAMTPRKKGPAPVADEVVLIQESLQEIGVTTLAVNEHWYNEPLNQGWDGWESSWNPRFHLYSTAEAQADKVIRLLRTNTGRRFFLYTHLEEPHHDYLLHAGFDGFGSDARGRYRSELAFTDHHVGRIIDVIRGELTARPTLVILSADHGEGLGQHGVKYHNGGFWRELTNVPLIVWHPALEHRVLDEPVTLYDIAPTLRNLYGLSPREDHVGTSLLPQFLRGDELPGRVVYQQGLYDQGGRYYNLVAVTRGSLRLMHDLRRGTWEFYDIAVDPDEERNLAREGEPRFEELKALLEDWLADIGLDATFVHRPWEAEPPGAR
jgi:arylsulfatase A-like enzyme